MPNSEPGLSANTQSTQGEIANTPRQVDEQRGEKTLEAKAQRERDLLEHRAKIEEEIKAIEEKQAKIRNVLGKIPESTSATSPDDTSENPAPQADTPPAPISAPEEPVSQANDPEGNDPEGNHQSEEDPAADSELESSPEATQDAVIDKSKKNTALKKVLAVAAAAVLAGLAVFGFTRGNKDGKDNKQQNDTPQSVTATETTGTVDNGAGENQETKGIYDGYGEKGMWLSKDKGGIYDFASAREVAEVCNNNEREMIKYTARNQVESYADYLANLPEELQPDGFKGLTILETEQKLEGLSDEEYEAIRQQFNDTVDGASIRRVVVQGEQNNAYMRLKNSNGSVNHSNMELVTCSTNESNLEVTQLYWVDKDGKEIGSMTIKILPDYNNDGSINSFGGCLQALSSNRRIYIGLTTITENPPSTSPTPDNPTTTPDKPTTTPDAPTNPPDNPPDTPPGTTVPSPKDTDAEYKNAQEGQAKGRVVPQTINESVTPKTTLEQDQANFNAIDQQQQEDAAKAAEAERTAREQQAAEEAARLQRLSDYQAAANEVMPNAENERLANEAAANAARAAEEAQRVANENARQRAAESAELERRQAEADAAANTSSNGTGNMGDYTVSDNAELYNQLINGQ